MDEMQQLNVKLAVSCADGAIADDCIRNICEIEDMWIMTEYTVTAS
jgi:hypothetical protein